MTEGKYSFIHCPFTKHPMYAEDTIHRKTKLIEMDVSSTQMYEELSLILVGSLMVMLVVQS